MDKVEEAQRIIDEAERLTATNKRLIKLNVLILIVYAVTTIIRMYQ